nr:hypothetical protein [Tanacetum cinerariifolium]
KKSKKLGRVPTEMELILEHIQQGISYEISVSAEGVEELKRNVKIKGIRDVLLMLEILSRKFFLKLNLSDYRSILTDLQETLKRRWRYLVPSELHIHNRMLIPNYQDIKYQDFCYSDELSNLGRYEHVSPMSLEHKCQPMNQNFYNSNSSGFDQTQPPQFPVIHPPPQETSIETLHDQENTINYVQTFLRKFNRYFFFETPKVLLLAWDRVFKIKDAFGNKQYKPEDIQELFRGLFNDVQNIHEELAEYIYTPGWNRPAFYNNGDDDDVDYTIAITPVLSTEEPDNSLSMGDEHLDTILATESDEVIKSGVEVLVSIPSKSEGIPDTMCDVHLVNNPTPLEAKDHFEIVINSNDDYSSSDNGSLYNENSENLPDQGEWISILNYRICENLSSTTRVNLPVEDDHSPLLAYVVWILLAYLTYPVIPPYLHSFRNEDTIFDPGITINRFYSFKPGLSHRCGTFKKFNTHRSHLNESPMEILFSTCFLMDQ